MNSDLKREQKCVRQFRYEQLCHQPSWMWSVALSTPWSLGKTRHKRNNILFMSCATGCKWNPICLYRMTHSKYVRLCTFTCLFGSSIYSHNEKNIHNETGTKGVGLQHTVVYIHTRASLEVRLRSNKFTFRTSKLEFWIFRSPKHDQHSFVSFLLSVWFL